MAGKKKTYNTNLIRDTLTYSTYEIASLFHVHRVTVLSWYKSGLQRIDNKKPFLVMGFKLRQFIRDKQQRRKIKCKKDEFYCCKCHSSQRPKDNRVALRHLNKKVGQLYGVCSKCGGKINKMISRREYRKFMDCFVIVKAQD